MALLEVRNVTKSFPFEKGTIHVLEDVNLSVDLDEFVCIVGPSGCGKSTLLRVIAGLEHPDSGEVLFHGKPYTTPSPAITIIFQLFGLLPWKTAMENVELPLEILGLDKDAGRERARAHIKMVGLEGFENAYPHDLSGGMKQRVGIARALSLHPEVLLMDEPFSSLDELTAKSLRALVLDIWRDPTLPTNSFLMVSHNVEEAVYMADRVVIMSARPGRIVGEVKVDIPRPRTDYLRKEAYFRRIDEVVGLLEESNNRHIVAPPPAAHP